jgi:hypothetical protein
MEEEYNLERFIPIFPCELCHMCKIEKTALLVLHRAIVWNVCETCQK